MKRKTGSGRICIGGYAGCGNLGDDAILTALIGGLLRHGAGREKITVLSGDPRLDRRRFRVRCRYRKNLFSVLGAFIGSDLFVCGGGSLLQNRTGTLSLLYYLFLLALARRCGCRTVCLGGIGPIRGPFFRRLTGHVLTQVDLLLLRDPLSAAFASALGVPDACVRVGADPAFLLPLPPPGRGVFLRRSLLPSGGTPYCCLSLRAGPEPGGTDLLLAAVARCAVLPILLVADRDRDAEHAARIGAKAGLRSVIPRDSSELLAWVSGARFVISQRLHPLILSVRASVPCVGIGDGSDDRKLPAFCAQARLPCLPPDAGEEDLLAAIGAAIGSRRRALPDLRRRAEADCRAICALASGERVNPRRKLPDAF